MKFGLSEETYSLIKKVVENNSQYEFKIFGSRAKGNYKTTSDIDIAVFKNVEEKDKYKIKNELDELDIIYKIDLIFVNSDTKKELLESIKREGVDF